MKQTHLTKRDQLFENDKVKVWKTSIDPAKPLAMHRHENPRVVVPLTDIKAKQLFEDSNNEKAVAWAFGQAYWLDADPPGELHGYVNETDHEVEVIVIELKQKDHQSPKLI